MADILRGIVAVVVDIVVDTVDAFVGGGGSARYGGRHPDLLLLRCACCCCAEIQLPPVSRKLVGEVIRVIHGLIFYWPRRPAADRTDVSCNRNPMCQPSY